MAATATAKTGERLEVTWRSQRLEVPYVVVDATDRNDAYAAILAAAPPAITGYPTASGVTATLSFTDMRLEEMPTPIKKGWDGWAIYEMVTFTAVRMTGETAAQFETGGGAQHITQAIRHVGTAVCNGATSTPDFKGAINVGAEGDIGGTDIPTPVFRLSLTMYKSKAAVNSTYLNNLYKGTGTTNNADITIHVEGQALTFLRGELLLEGASGGLRGSQDWEITVRLSASPNVADVCAAWDTSIKPAIAVPKKGWEFAWVYFEDFYDQSTTPARRVKRPQTVNVEQVFLESNYSLLGLP